MKTTLTLEQAEAKVRSTLGDHEDLIPHLTEEIPGIGWYFCPQSKKYIQTDDPRDMLVGSCGVLVNKDTGEIYRMGSAYPREYWIEAYQKGIGGVCDLLVTSVKDKGEAVELLLALRLLFVEPEEAYGEVWTIPQTFSRNMLMKCLDNLPVRFEDQSLVFHLEVIKQLEESCALEFEIIRKR